MDSAFSSSSVDELIRNAELRTELEPYSDEAITRIHYHHWTLREENQFLASMLLWEKAPVLPIYEWFEPALRFPHPQNVSDEELPRILTNLVQKLYEKHIVLDFTDHLSDRELYRLIVQKILPANEKKIEFMDVYHHWDCSRDPSRYDDEEGKESEAWLTYYASDEERDAWAETHDGPLPEKRTPLHRRHFPKDESFRYDS